MQGELHVLLIEDNPGDVRLIEEMLRDAEALFERVESGPGAPALHHEPRLSDGLAAMEETDYDVVLLDLNLPDSTGFETLEAVADATDATPVVVLTGLDDRELGIQAIQRGAQDYLVKGEVTSDVLVRSIHHAIERHESIQRIEAQRAQLQTLTSVYRVVQAIQQDVTRQASREDMEQTVCDRLVEIEPYRFAWIGHWSITEGVITPAAWAGHGDSYLDEVSPPVDEDAESHGPGGEAIRTGEVQVVADVTDSETFAPWRDAALAHDFRSAAAIPIVYEGTTYGVIAVYASAPDAFGPEVRDVLGGLGELLGHAIAASTQRQALQSELVVAAEFRFDGLADVLGFDEPPSGSIQFTRVVPLGQGTYLLYGRIPADGRDDVAELVATDAVDDVRMLSEADEVEFELRLTDPPVLPTVAAYGGRFVQSVLDQGDLTATIEFPPSVEIREIVDQLRASHPDLEIHFQRRETRERSEFPRTAPLDELTPRQRTALETSYFGGYFEWPRDSSAEEIADQMGIAAPTFHQHLRKAQKQVLERVIEE